MQYVDFNNHHYGFYVTYYDSRLKVILIENKQKVCNVTCFVENARLSTFNNGYGWVNLTQTPFLEQLLEEMKCTKTGRKMSATTDNVVEYDLSPLVKFNNQEMKRHLMKPGMIQVGEGQFVSTSVVYYACHLKNPEKYLIVTTESINWTLDKKFFVAAIRDYNIPVYKRCRKEIY